MRWPWIKPTPDEPDARHDSINEAREARESSEQDLRDIRDQGHEVEAVVDHLKEIKVRNHLAEIFVESIKRKRGPANG